jgi:CheY-like chemotaxis protein
MSRTCAIALAGLPPTERVLIEGALFPPGASPIPGAFMTPDPTRAALVIANADDAAVVSALRAQVPAAGVVLLGSSDRGTGWPVVPRPLSLQAVITAARRQLALAHPDDEGAEKSKAASPEGNWFRRFGKATPVFSDTQPFPVEPMDAEDGFARTRQFEPEPLQARTSPVPKAVPRQEPEDFQPTRQFSPSVPSVTPSDWENEVAEWESAQSAGPAAPAAKSVPPASAISGPAAEPGSAEPDGDTLPAPLRAADRILIVGLPGSAAAGLIRVLEAAGYPVDFAGSPEAVSRHLMQHAYQFAVLIEVSLGTKAITLCRDIQRNRGCSPPDLRLLIVANHRGFLSRMRAWFAGCNVWLPIPLDQPRLLQYLRDNGSDAARGG